MGLAAAGEMQAHLNEVYPGCSNLLLQVSSLAQTELTQCFEHSLSMPDKMQTAERRVLV